MKRSRQVLLTDGFQTVVPDVVENRPSEDVGTNFYMTLHNVKRIAAIFESIRDDVETNIKFTPTGMDVFAFLADKTTAIAITIDQSIFAQYKCTTDYMVTVNLGIFAKKLNILQKFRCDSVSITSDVSGDLIMRGIQGRNNNQISINSLSSTLPEFNTADIKYKSYFSISTEILNRYITNMPNVFELKVSKGGLTFIGKEELSKTELNFKLDEAVLNSIDGSYNQTFSKQYLQPLLKLCKLFPTVTLGLDNDNPLFARFEICQKLDVASSVVDLYFSSRIQD